MHSLSSNLTLFTFGYILGSMFSDIDLETSLKVLFDICCPIISPLSFIPKYNFPLLCLFKIDTIEIIPSFNSLVVFLNYTTSFSKKFILAISFTLL